MKTSRASRLDFSILILLAGMVLQVAWYSLVYLTTLNAEGYIQDLDFRAFYTGGKIAFDGDWGNVYDTARQLDVQREITGKPLSFNELLSFNHPPLLLPIQRLVAAFDYRSAYLLWNVLSFFFILLNAFLVYKIVRKAGWETAPTWFFTIQVVLFYPIFVSLCKGQDTIVVLIGLSICLAGLYAQDEKKTGLGLALLVMRPQIAIPLALPFVFKQRKTWWWFVAFALILGLFSLLMIGGKGALDYVHLLLLSDNGESITIHQYDMYDLKGALIRAFVGRESNRVIDIASWLAFAANCVFLCALWQKSARIDLRHIGLAVILSLFFSPHLQYHDLGLLLTPVLALCLLLTTNKLIQPLSAALILLAVSTYMAIVQISPLPFAGIYLFMFLLAAGLWYWEKFPWLALKHPANP